MGNNAHFLPPSPSQDLRAGFEKHLSSQSFKANSIKSLLAKQDIRLLDFHA